MNDDIGRYTLIRRAGKVRAIRTPSGPIAPWNEDAVCNELNKLHRALALTQREKADALEHIAELELESQELK